jgi:hypothetical protein
LRVFDSEGKQRWEDRAVNFVWHVTAGDLDGDGTLEVISTSNSGDVRVFNNQGKESKRLDPDIYANMVRVFRLPGESADSLIVVGTGEGKTQMAALNGNGDVLWRADLPDGVTQCNSLVWAPGTTWAALGCLGGLVCVIDVRSGEMIGAASHQGTTPQVAWVTADGKPLLVAASGTALSAWHIKPKDGGGKE